MSNPINGRHIVLGVTGSIAAYKSAEIASSLTKQGAVVDTVLTQSAERFISPLTFQSVTGRKAYTESDLWGGEGHVVHISLARKADLIVIAPASANTIAKIANGIADNLLAVTVLAAQCPILIAPAMDAGMYANPATQHNVAILKERGAEMIGPEEGHLASGLKGPGRMSEPADILASMRYLFSRGNPLRGKHIIISAGGTVEAVDPVRILTNRSSGKQGYALAQAALDAGSDVTLISAPTHLAPPTGAKLVLVESADQMNEAVLAEAPHADALIMAAAVADFRPMDIAAEKIKKSSNLQQIALVRTEDILHNIAKLKAEMKLDLKVVGFAAESEHLKDNAREKMQQKKMDMIVANDISDPEAGFGVDTNKVLLMYSDGSTEQLPKMEKIEVAEKVIQHLSSWLIEGVA
jgi:phosphopantothenoylcysteine decarboxylase / phosphopantothenate---cysteine ligase